MAQVVILAGGLGTRLKPITEKIPKPMVEVAGRPFLFWQLLDLKLQNVKDVVLLVAYLGEQIETYFTQQSVREELNMNLQFVYESEPLGTGGALANAFSKLQPEFILLNGDSFLHLNLKAMHSDWESRRRRGENLLAMVATYDQRVPTPVLNNLKISSGLVSAYQKDAGKENGFTHVDSGVYMIDRKLIADALKNPEYGIKKYQLEQLWHPLITKRQVAAYSVYEKFYDIGTIERLKEFEENVRDYFKNSLSS